MVGRRSMRVALLVVAAAFGAACVPVDDAEAVLEADADVVLILPVVGQDAYDRQRAVLEPWLDGLGLTYSLVPLSAIAPRTELASLTPTRVRDYLRTHFTSRLSTEDRPRYLGILAPPSVSYNGPGGRADRVVPRFTVDVGITDPFTTDVPYGVLAPDTIDGGDGIVEPTDLDLTRPTFEVFRVPVVTQLEVQAFVRRHRQFMASAYRSDLTLVSGEIGLFTGDASVVQCLNAANLAGVATQILKVLDSTAAQCQPDVLTGSEGPRAADVLADPGGPFAGGTIIDVSHGSPTSIHAGSLFGTPSSSPFVNLGVSDVASIPTDRLNVFISIACDNDAPLRTTVNLASAMYRRASVAVVSATTVVTPVNVDDVLFAEVEAIATLFEEDDTLAQRMQAFRSEYYERFVLAATGLTREHLWTNVLTVGIVGDGLVTVAP